MHHEEHDETDDGELDHRIDEAAEGDHRRIRCLCLGQGRVMRTGKIDEQRGEVDLAEQQSYWRHHDVIDEHAAATNRMHTGRPVSGTVKYPSLGSVIAHEPALLDLVPDPALQ